MTPVFHTAKMKFMSMNDGVKTAVRTVNLFEAFSRRKGPMTLTQISEALSAPISSCHGLVRTLSAKGYLYTSERNRAIYPTRRLLEVANTIATHDPVLESIVPLLEVLRDETNETILLGRRQGETILYLDVIEGGQTLRYSAGAGDIKPMHSSAIGKAFLGRLNDAERAALVARLPLDLHTPNTITERATLEADLAEGIAKGYFVTRGENVVDVMGLATNADVYGEAMGIAIAGPLVRMEAGETELAAQLLAAKARLEALGDSS